MNTVAAEHDLSLRITCILEINENYIKISEQKIRLKKARLQKSIDINKSAPLFFNFHNKVGKHVYLSYPWIYLKKRKSKENQNKKQAFVISTRSLVILFVNFFQALLCSMNFRL